MWIQWRLNDPAIEWRQRWTRAHVTFDGWSRTACGLVIPEAYDMAQGEHVPDAAPRCRRCLVARGEGVENELSREMEKAHVRSETRSWQ